MPIPSSHQRFIVPDLPTADQVLPFLRQIDENRWYSNFGPLNNFFERLFIQAMAAAHGEPRRAATAHWAVCVSSGYHALSVGLRLLGLGPGKRVLIPAVTFPACPLAVENLGAETVLADVDPQTWLLTPAIARAIAARMQIDAVMPVAVYGLPHPVEGWDAFTADTGIPVIIDAAAAVESQRYPRQGLVAHSLHALKPFGIGEGGLLVTPDKEMAVTARQIINFGMQDRITYRSGENAKMSEYHAAIALAQLERWDEIKKRRRGVYETYLAALAAQAPQAQPHPDFEKTVASCLMVAIKGISSTEFLAALLSRGVAAHRTYLPPLYAHPHLAGLTVAAADGTSLRTTDLATKAALMQGAEHMNSHVIGLPFHAFLGEGEILRASKMLGEYLDV